MTEADILIGTIEDAGGYTICVKEDRALYFRFRKLYTRFASVSKNYDEAANKVSFFGQK